MSPKEKAKSLYEDFNLETGMMSSEVKKCAIKCAYEVIRQIAITTSHCTLNTLDSVEVQHDIKYWNNIIIELKCL